MYSDYYQSCFRRTVAFVRDIPVSSKRALLSPPTEGDVLSESFANPIGSSPHQYHFMKTKNIGSRGTSTLISKLIVAMSSKLLRFNFATLVAITLSISGVSLTNTVVAQTQVTTIEGVTGPFGAGNCTQSFELFVPSNSVTSTTVVKSVELNLTHTLTGDLEIYLESPTGQLIALSTNNGVGGADYTGTVFEDGGADITSASNPFSGTYAPEGSSTGTSCTPPAGTPISTLAGFTTGTMEGTWNLLVLNDGGNAGTVDSWSITFNTPPTFSPVSGSTILNLSAGTSFTSAMCGELLEVTVSNTSGFVDLYTMQFTTEWDPSQLEYYAYEAQPIGTQDPIIGTTGTTLGGYIQYTWADLVAPTTLADNTPFLKLFFQVKNGATGLATVGFNLETTAPSPLESIDTSGNQIIVNTNAITINLIPLTVAMSSTAALCAGGATGTATATPSSGTAPYSFAWSNGQTSTGATSTASGLPAGGYDVTVTDANGCTVIGGVTVGEATALVPYVNSIANVVCYGGTGTVNLAVSGGTAPYTYAVGLNPQSTTTYPANVPFAIPLPAGVYYIIVQDAAGCQATVSATVTQPPQLVTQIVSYGNISCNGGSDGFEVANVTGGTPSLSAFPTYGYGYAWSGSASTQTTPNVTNLPADIYTVTVSDYLGCTTTASMALTEPGLLTATASVVNDPLCFGGATGSVTVTPSGGTA
ncbi:MAG: hypothetical protein RIQ78_665, partial [Bacteroidota bacterium]